MSFMISNGEEAKSNRYQLLCSPDEDGQRERSGDGNKTKQKSNKAGQAVAAIDSVQTEAETD